MPRRVLFLFLSIFFITSYAHAQQTQITVSFNEQFFDALLDAIFTNLKQPDFPLAKNGSKFKVQRSKLTVSSFSEGNSKEKNPFCDEKIVLQREMNGVRTAVRFRDGKIYAPIAFSGSYNPPLIGCVDFQGYAETNIDLEFNQQQQTLIGKVRVLKVQLGNMPSVAGGFVARLVQSSIDNKINPIEILRADKLTFVIPVQDSGGSLRMRATGMQPEVGNGVLNVHVSFEFLKEQ